MSVTVQIVIHIFGRIIRRICVKIAAISFPNRIKELIYSFGNSSADGVSTSAVVSPQAQVLRNRYCDAYIVAKVTVGIGGTIKIIAFILAAVIVLGSFALATLPSEQRGSISGASGGAALIIVVFGVFYGLVVGFIGYVIGVIVSSQGQVLEATLDNTVGNSPFLTNECKAEIMSFAKE